MATLDKTIRTGLIITNELKANKVSAVELTVTGTFTEEGAASGAVSTTSGDGVDGGAFAGSGGDGATTPGGDGGDGGSATVDGGKGGDGADDIAGGSGGAGGDTVETGGEGGSGGNSSGLVDDGGDGGKGGDSKLNGGAGGDGGDGPNGGGSGGAGGGVSTTGGKGGDGGLDTDGAQMGGGGGNGGIIDDRGGDGGNGTVSGGDPGGTGGLSAISGGKGGDHFDGGIGGTGGFAVAGGGSGADGAGGGNGGDVTVTAGNGGAGTSAPIGDGGSIELTGGDGLNGGGIQLTGGDGTVNGGNITIGPGSGPTAGSVTITGLVIPTADDHPTRKDYVDGLINGLDVRAPVRVASIGSDITIATPGTTLDGVTLVTGDRILLKDQTLSEENGIYIFGIDGTTPLVRSDDADDNELVTNGLYTEVIDGINQGGNSYVLTTPDPIVLDTTGLTFSSYQGTRVLAKGKTGGQLIIGGLNGTNNLTLQSTAGAPRGQIVCNDELSMSSKKIVNVLDPTADQDAVTKKYFDDNAVLATGGPPFTTNNIAVFTGATGTDNNITQRNATIDATGKLTAPILIGGSSNLSVYNLPHDTFPASGNPASVEIRNDGTILHKETRINSGGITTPAIVTTLSGITTPAGSASSFNGNTLITDSIVSTSAELSAVGITTSRINNARFSSGGGMTAPQIDIGALGDENFKVSASAAVPGVGGGDTTDVEIGTNAANLYSNTVINSGGITTPAVVTQNGNNIITGATTGGSIAIENGGGMRITGNLKLDGQFINDDVSVLVHPGQSDETTINPFPSNIQKTAVISFQTGFAVNISKLNISANGGVAGTARIAKYNTLYVRGRFASTWQLSFNNPTFAASPIIFTGSDAGQFDMYKIVFPTNIIGVVSGFVEVTKFIATDSTADVFLVYI